jgi:pantothenate kinase
MQLLSYATKYWSKGTIKALFLEHEVKLFFQNLLKSF